MTRSATNQSAPALVLVVGLKSYTSSNTNTELGRNSAEFVPAAAAFESALEVAPSTLGAMRVAVFRELRGAEALSPNVTCGGVKSADRAETNGAGDLTSAVSAGDVGPELATELIDGEDVAEEKELTAEPPDRKACTLSATE
jgi:hypothetical protein